MGALSLLLSLSCSLPKPATPGCSTRPINSPQGWARDGDPEPVHIEENDSSFVIDWKGAYRIEGPAFIYSDRQTPRVSTILGYPTGLLAPPA